MATNNRAAATGTTGTNTTAAPATTAKLITTSREVLRLINVEDFDEILTEAGTKFVIVEFYAEWCGPCRLIASKLENWVQTYDVIVVKVDVEDFEELAIQYDVSSMPKFVVIKEKQIVHSFEGSNTKDLENFFEKTCQKNPERANLLGTGITNTEAEAQSAVRSTTLLK